MSSFSYDGKMNMWNESLRLKLSEHHQRVHLAHLPTPLEAMPRLTEFLGGPPLYIKRDDCTGLAGGGNKARQLEFYLGAALAEGADTIITTGAVQSNHVRSTSAACARLGMLCHVQLEDRVAGLGDDYAHSGNILLDRLLGAVIHRFPVGEDEAGADAAMANLAHELSGQGRRPYIIPLSIDHVPLGAIGYVVAAKEIVAQAAEQNLTIGAVVTPSGSASTHAGLVTGLRAAGATMPVIGICVRRDAEAQRQRLMRRIGEVCDLIGAPGVAGVGDIKVMDETLAPGYGQLNDATREAVRLGARLEGLILDPVYTGKALAGLIGLVRSGALSGAAPVVFLHTGGWPAVFAYREEIESL